MFKNPSVLFLILLGFVGCNTLRMSEKGTRNNTIEKSGTTTKSKRLKIAQTAKKQIGIKYKYAGKTPKSGFDCSGFTHFVMKNHGVQLSGSSAMQSEIGRKIDLKKAQQGDLVFFKRGGKGRVFHVAMIYENKNGNPKVIHSTSSRGVVIEELLTSTYWEPKIWQVRDVID